ncbi:methyltransferase domain-containing protein [candidate division WOR-3 bacterium]|nr:methyltransferase domain-containing protein [candidate division WOR-3 bacterium]
MDFTNVYRDENYAAAYAKLEFSGTYYLAFRDLPEIVSRHIRGQKALDIGCGTGRSTRFLRNLGFDAVGVDIADQMVKKAKEIDPSGDYLLVQDGDLSQFSDDCFDPVLSAFTFDNIPIQSRKVKLFCRMSRVLKSSGRIVNLVSTPDIYLHEWTSFSTVDFPDNLNAKSGDKVRIIVTALEDLRPAVDILWTDEDYRKTYELAGLGVVDKHLPLGKPDEPYDWVSETTKAPWAIYILAKD